MSDNQAANAETGKAKRKEPTINTVVMKDGRPVDFVGEKRKLMKESFITDDGKVQVRLDFVNGETRLFTIPEGMLHKFAAHGAEQKLGDEMAGLADVDDAVLAIDELIDRLYSGDWSQKRDANGLAGTSVLLRALVELYNGAKTVDEVRTFLKGKTQQEKLALRINPKIKPIVERLEAEKASKASKIDSDGLLAELGG